MSDSKIPLLTDIVADEDAEDAAPETPAEPAQAAEQVPPLEPVQPAQLVDALEDIVVFEADDSRPGDTATHYVPSAETLQPAQTSDAADLVQPAASLEDDIPDSVRIDDVETVIAELQTRIASHTYELTDELMRAAFSDLEAKVFRQISTNLRQQLPELIDSVVREHLLERSDRSEDKE